MTQYNTDMITSQALPHYRTPPVTEVVCGVQFEPLSHFLSVHFGEFWQRIKDEFPKVDDKPPLDEVREGPVGLPRRAEIVAFDLPPHRRVFYIDPTDNFVLQVQPSRFHSNWRRERDGDEYPRFVVAFDRFVIGWNAFLEFVKDSGLDAPCVNQYELTYINHILEAEGDEFPRDIGRYVPLISWDFPKADAILPAAETVAVRIACALPESQGRLHVTLSHGVRVRDKKRAIILDLTARGPAKSDWADMEEWFALAHEWIVRGFTDLTSRAAHSQWGRDK